MLHAILALAGTFVLVLAALACFDAWAKRAYARALLVAAVGLIVAYLFTVVPWEH